jgi:hypothetical protein
VVSHNRASVGCELDSGSCVGAEEVHPVALHANSARRDGDFPATHTSLAWTRASAEVSPRLSPAIASRHRASKHPPRLTTFAVLLCRSPSVAAHGATPVRNSHPVAIRHPSRSLSLATALPVPETNPKLHAFVSPKLCSQPCAVALPHPLLLPPTTLSVPQITPYTTPHVVTNYANRQRRSYPSHPPRALTLSARLTAIAASSVISLSSTGA